MTSNRNSHDIDTKLIKAARDAVCTRMLVYEFCDPKYDPNVRDARQNQPQRQPDFLHITFRNDDGDSCDVDELIDEVCKKLGASLDNCKKLILSSVESRPCVYNGKPLSVDKNFLLMMSRSSVGLLVSHELGNRDVFFRMCES